MAKRAKRLPRQQKPDAIRMDYYKAIRPLLEHAKALIDKTLIPALPDLIEEANPHQDADPKKKAKVEAERVIAAAQKKFEEALRPRELEALADKYASRTDDFQKAQLDRQTRSAFGVGLDQISRSERGIKSKIDAWIAENVDLIVTLPDVYFDDVRSQVFSAIESGTRHEVLARRLQERYDIADNRAALIARDQIGKLYGNLNQGRQENLGVKRYIWRDSGDNRVRPEHEDRNGDEFAWDSPPEDGHPGEPVNCRCYAEPIFEALAE